jgi:tungstate transport system ATP-binding protein
MVNQRPILFTTTVYKNLEFGLKIRKVPKKKRDRIIAESLDLVGMNHMVQAQAHKLSGGETQRVALARALALSPDVILCDEPTSSVDLENQVTIINLLRQINKEKKITLIFTSHDKLQAASLAHQTLFLDQGRLATASYENLFTGVLTAKESGLALCVIQNSLTLSISSDKTGKVRLLIDPEKIDFAKNVENRNPENHLQGKVVQVAQEKGKIRVVVKSGVYITLLLSLEQYSEVRPMVGETVHIAIAPDAVKII